LLVDKRADFLSKLLVLGRGEVSHRSQFMRETA
jgi:hypothetical protein